MSWTWQTHDLAFPGAVDPWIEWRLQRSAGKDASRQVLCKRSEILTPPTMRALGWQVPSAYSDDATFFTARCAVGAACKMPQGASGFVAGDDDVSALPALESRAASTRAPAPIDRRAAAPSGHNTVLAVIDADIAFLHQQFRDAAGRSRVRAHWDQGIEAEAPPWRRPQRTGYGREVLGAEIDASLRADASERATYGRFGVTLPGNGWSHGTQVLALAAGRTSHNSDAAAELPLLTVSVPRCAFTQTHGLWLNVYLLDALHFILSHVGSNESVVVNVSLGAHSGPHDGRSLLEQALDQLIDAQQGRLTVVLAAGNSRLVRAHAGAGWPADSGQSLSAAIEMTGDDPTPNFVEAWIDGRSGDARFEVTPPPTVAAASGEVAPGQCACLRDQDGHVVAMAYCGLARSLEGRTHAVHALMAVAATRGLDGSALGTARAGAWSLRVSSDAETSVRMWVARDDSIVYGLEPKSFSQSHPDSAVSMANTMSSLCGAQRAIVVGGYVQTAGFTPAMYESSGEAAAVGEGVSGRAAPDLCALARLPATRWIGCFSDEAPPAPWLLEGTSIAAPYATRALANLTAQHGRQSRDALLDRLRQAEPSLSVTPTARVSWTSAYWLRCE